MERPLNPGLHQKQPPLIEYYGSFGLLNKRDKSREMKKTFRPTTPPEAAHPAGISPLVCAPEQKGQE
jgi:hypothetical protein